ncbi:MAG TPA: hypothetical protein VHG93_13070 [Longimicrobium sp.]|nr:hypothetical protein [Longimicrobium sp.]
MRVIVAQILMSVAELAFAGAALLAARASAGRAHRFAYAWAFTGWAFLVQGANSLFHDAFSLVAFLQGAESASWAAVLRWHPILSHSRTFLLTTYAVVLAVMLYRFRAGTGVPPLRRPLAVMVAGMVLGAVVGWQEPEFTRATHYSAVAVFDVMELLAFMVLLIVGITSGRMDRSLWSALALYGFTLALSVLLFAAIARFDVAGEWSPSPFAIQGVKTALRFVMVAIVIQHLRALRRGDPVRGLIDEPLGRVPMASLHG